MRQKSDSAGNQQLTARTLTTEDLAWLAGLIDGDGYFALRRNTTGQYTPCIGITNNNPNIIDEAASVLKAANIGRWVWWGKNRKQSSKWKKCAEIRIEGLKRANKFFEIMMSHIRGKRDRAKILKEFVDLRLSKWHKQDYGEAEERLYNQLRKLNSRKLRDYTLDTEE